MNKVKADGEELAAAFCSTTLNQYFFDERAYIFFNQKIADFNGIPRPSKWLGKNRFILSIILKYSSYIQLFWSYLFAYILFTFQALICCAKVQIKKKSNQFYSKTLALAVCSRSYEVISQAVPASNDKLWLELKVGGVSRHLSTGKEHFTDCLSIVSIGLIFKSLLIAFQIHKFIRNHEDKKLILQTYTAFNWVLALSTLEKIAPNKIITAEHHDRWAILIDYYCSRMKKQGKNIEFVVVQHGNEYSQTYSNLLDDIKYRDLPYKLQNVTEMYVYDELQKKLFLENIISAKKTQLNFPKVNFYEFKIVLHDTGKDGVCILFVGHPVCEKLHIHLFKSMKNKSIHFFYKPHPTCKYNQKNNPGWIVIEGSSQFPKVDLLISYPSTLVDEYAKANVNAFVHQLSTSEDQYANVVHLLHRNLNKSNLARQ